jgi:predicted DNA binding CopG/RHH family protein
VKKPFPSFDSDEKLEAFLDTADLDDYDLTAGALPRDHWFARYERFAKDASIHPRLPEDLLDAVRSQAAKEKIPTQRLIREFIERKVADANSLRASRQSEVSRGRRSSRRRLDLAPAPPAPPIWACALARSV